MGSDVTGEDIKARVLIEKKTVLNLIDAFCVAVKHYLRGETGMMCTQRVFGRFNFTPLQTSITRTCITRPNIFRHTHCPRVFRPVMILQVICLLQSRQSPSRSGSSKWSTASLPMPVVQDLFLLAVINVNPWYALPLSRPPTFPCLPLLLERLEQKLESPNTLRFRSRLELPTQAFEALVRWRLWAKPTCCQHAIPLNIHSSTSSLSLFWSSFSPSVVGS